MYIWRHDLFCLSVSDHFIWRLRPINIQTFFPVLAHLNTNLLQTVDISVMVFVFSRTSSSDQILYSIHRDGVSGEQISECTSQYMPHILWPVKNYKLIKLAVQTKNLIHLEIYTHLVHISNSLKKGLSYTQCLHEVKCHLADEGLCSIIDGSLLLLDPAREDRALVGLTVSLIVLQPALKKAQCMMRK